MVWRIRMGEKADVMTGPLRFVLEYGERKKEKLV